MAMEHTEPNERDEVSATPKRDEVQPFRKAIMARTLKEDSEIYRAIAIFKVTNSKYSSSSPNSVRYVTHYFGPHLAPGLCKAAVTRESQWRTAVHVAIQRKMNEWETVEEWYEAQYAQELWRADGVDRRHLVR